MTESSPVETVRTHDRTFQVGGREHLICLGADAWAAFDEFCAREGVSGEELCARAAQRIGDDSLADKLLGLLTGYFKDAADADPPPPLGLAEDDGATPRLSPALSAALDAVGK